MPPSSTITTSQYCVFIKMNKYKKTIKPVKLKKMLRIFYDDKMFHTNNASIQILLKLDDADRHELQYDLVLCVFLPNALL